MSRLLQETMRCLLYSSQLPLTFWNYAIIYGAFLYLAPNHHMKNTFGQQPKLNLVRVFGAPGLMKLPGQQQPRFNRGQTT